MVSSVHVRAMGDIPISIGTSLSLQGLYNEYPDRKPERIKPVLKADVLYINVRTLLRNIMNAIEESDKSAVKTADYVLALKDELREISNYINHKDEKIKVYFYLPTYDSLHKEFGSTADLRMPTTDLQKAKLDVEKDVFGTIERELKALPEEKHYINIIDMKIKSTERVRAFLLTHLPVDLLYTSGFSKVLLLESHTGKVKDENEWYTKFSAEASERVPFNKATLIFFGDSGGMFKPQHIKARNALMKVAEKYKWTFSTTKDRILNTLKLSGEGIIEQNIRKMFR